MFILLFPLDSQQCIVMCLYIQEERFCIPVYSIHYDVCEIMLTCHILILCVLNTTFDGMIKYDITHGLSSATDYKYEEINLFAELLCKCGQYP